MGAAPQSRPVIKGELSPADKQCELYRSFADICGIRPNVKNQLTESDFSDFQEILKCWKLRFSVVFSRITDLLELLKKNEKRNEKQLLLYSELSDLHTMFVFFESCNTRERMLEFVRCISALPLMESAMTDYALEQARNAGASERELERIRVKKRFFCGDLTKWHRVRNKKPWDDGSKVTFNLSALVHQINKMAKWAGFGVQPGNTKSLKEQVDDLLFEVRLAELRKDPLKLTGIDRLVKALADKAARNFLDKLPPAGSKNCRQA